MAQLFRPGANAFAGVIMASIIGAPILAILLTFALWESPYATYQYITRSQPVPFSHQHHVGQLGIDCRYCHTSVETSSFAGIPPTKTCMNCHQEIWFGSPTLEPVRAAYKSGDPIPWRRVHNLPGFVYFNHSIHVAKGVGCETCHGRVDEMPLTMQANSLLMKWCLDCHRDPG